MSNYISAAARDRCPEAWADDAACAGLNPRQWDLDVGTDQQLRAGQAICYGCPVIGPCLDRGRAGSAVGTLSAGLSWAGREGTSLTTFLKWRAGRPAERPRVPSSSIPRERPPKRPDQRRRPVGVDLDEALVARHVAGDPTAPLYAGRIIRREVIEAIRRLAAAGVGDPGISDHLGGRLTRSAVGWQRRAHGIAPGEPQGGNRAAAS